MEWIRFRNGNNNFTDGGSVRQMIVALLKRKDAEDEEDVSDCGEFDLKW